MSMKNGLQLSSPGINKLHFSLYSDNFLSKPASTSSTFGATVACSMLDLTTLASLTWTTFLKMSTVRAVVLQEALTQSCFKLINFDDKMFTCCHMPYPLAGAMIK
ncbi:hypothetical protein AMECASPLE_011189 [Ameca splendens]|uniref:Uncharacterized protein n=1 Tax=Ameca splendens TaxID=208324 RepID=A0ABV0Y0V2_9TELE